MIQRIIIRLILSRDIMQSIFDVWHHNVLVCHLFPSMQIDESGTQ